MKQVGASGDLAEWWEIQNGDSPQTSQAALDVLEATFPKRYLHLNVTQIQG